MDWSYFDQIRCINLKKRTERFEESKKIFKKYNIPVVFHQVNPHPLGGQRGCFESHQSLIRKAYEDGAETILIFEDDIDPTPFICQEVLNKAIEFMKTHPTWNIFFFGQIQNVLQYEVVPVTDHIDKMHAIAGHAYVVHRRFMPTIINQKYEDIPIDWYYHWNDEAYGLRDSFFYQHCRDSDISSIQDKFWRFWIGCQFPLASIYSRNINIPIYLLLAAILLLFVSLVGIILLQ